MDRRNVMDNPNPVWPPFFIAGLQSIYPLSTDLTQEDPPQHNWKLIDWDVNNQIKQTKEQIK